MSWLRNDEIAVHKWKVFCRSSVVSKHYFIFRFRGISKRVELLSWTIGILVFANRPIRCDGESWSRYDCQRYEGVELFFSFMIIIISTLVHACLNSSPSVPRADQGWASLYVETWAVATPFVFHLFYVLADIESLFLYFRITRK